MRDLLSTNTVKTIGWNCLSQRRDYMYYCLFEGGDDGISSEEGKSF